MISMLDKNDAMQHSQQNVNQLIIRLFQYFCISKYRLIFLASEIVSSSTN